MCIIYIICAHPTAIFSLWRPYQPSDDVIEVQNVALLFLHPCIFAYLDMIFENPSRFFHEVVKTVKLFIVIQFPNDNIISRSFLSTINSYPHPSKSSHSDKAPNFFILEFFYFRISIFLRFDGHATNAC